MASQLMQAASAISHFDMVSLSLLRQSTFPQPRWNFHGGQTPEYCKSL
jgi:hypothetical protein